MMQVWWRNSTRRSMIIRGRGRPVRGISGRRRRSFVFQSQPLRIHWWRRSSGTRSKASRAHSHRLDSSTRHVRTFRSLLPCLGCCDLPGLASTQCVRSCNSLLVGTSFSIFARIQNSWIALTSVSTGNSILIAHNRSKILETRRAMD
jgi:hypothetical protein